MSLHSWLGHKLASFLAKPRDRLSITTSRPGLLAATLRKGDVLLVEGTSRFAGAIRYITQSTWSHSALCVGDALADRFGSETMLVEADVNDGVRAVPVSRYAHVHTRICRPVGLHEEEIEGVIGYAGIHGKDPHRWGRPDTRWYRPTRCLRTSQLDSC